MEQTISIPTDLKDLNLSQYQRFSKVIEGNTDEVFIRQKMVQIFCGIELKHVGSLTKKDFMEITDNISLVLESTPELVKNFTHKGVEYGFIPDLDNITLGEFIDLDNTLGDWEKMLTAMSVLYRPITEKKGQKYLIEPYKGEENQALETMPLDAVISSMLFFYHLSNELLNYMQNCSQSLVETKEIQKTLQKDLTKNGGGIPHLMHSLEEITEKFKQSLAKIYILPSYTYAI